MWLDESGQVKATFAELYQRYSEYLGAIVEMKEDWNCTTFSDKTRFCTFYNFTSPAIIDNFDEVYLTDPTDNGSRASIPTVGIVMSLLMVFLNV